MQESIKQCSKCKSTGILIRGKDDWDWRVHCPNGCIKVPFNEDDCYTSDWAAIKAWNKRIKQKPKIGCFDCGLNYPFGLDLNLPDTQWNWIFPEGDGEGTLCPNCIAKRSEKIGGSTVILCWIDRIDWSAPRPKKWLQNLKPSEIF